MKIFTFCSLRDIWRHSSFLGPIKKRAFEKKLWKTFVGSWQTLQRLWQSMILRDMLLHIWTRGPLITIQRELVTMLRCEKIDRLLTGKIIRSSRRPRDIFRSRDRSRRESYRRDITRYFKKMHVIKHFCLTIEWIWWRGEPGRKLHHAWETKRIAMDGRCFVFARFDRNSETWAASFRGRM